MTLFVGCSFIIQRSGCIIALGTLGYGLGKLIDSWKNSL